MNIQSCRELEYLVSWELLAQYKTVAYRIWNTLEELGGLVSNLQTFLSQSTPMWVN